MRVLVHVPVALFLACGGPVEMGFDGSVAADSAAEAGDASMRFDVVESTTIDVNNDQSDAAACLCAPAVPMGWELVTYDAKVRNVCPTGYTGMRTDTVEVSAPPSTCSCTCANGYQTPPK